MNCACKITNNDLCAYKIVVNTDVRYIGSARAVKHGKQ